VRLSTSLNYSGDPVATAATIPELESIGVDMVWVPEAYSFDAVSLMGYLAAKTHRIEIASGILPIYSRTPALLASTAAGLDAVSSGRFTLGIGTSGPQVIEGWHGVPYDRPLQRTREVIEVCRKVWRRETLVFDGEVVRIPLAAGLGTGLGKPLKLINRPVREHIPIYVGGIGPKNVELTAELADGWFPAMFCPDKAQELWGEHLASGLAVRDPALGPLQIVAGAAVFISSDQDEIGRLLDSHRPGLALYIGGMGAAKKNFYNELLARYGFEAEAAKIQSLYLDGHVRDAEAAVPLEFIRATSLVGDEGWIRERLSSYRAAGVTTLQVHPGSEWSAPLVEKLRLWTA
jgi:F420-dependent oxidoreductase-like protein